MYDFKQGDTVTFLLNRKECHGIIQKIGKKNASVWIEELYEERKIPIERLTYVAPVFLNTEQIQKLCRYEIKWSELIAGHPDYVDVCLEAPYTMTFEDMLAAARNIMNSGDDNETVREEWYCPLYHMLKNMKKDVARSAEAQTLR